MGVSVCISSDYHHNINTLSWLIQNPIPFKSISTKRKHFIVDHMNRVQKLMLTLLCKTVLSMKQTWVEHSQYYTIWCDVISYKITSTTAHKPRYNNKQQRFIEDSGGLSIVEDFMKVLPYLELQVGQLAISGIETIKELWWWRTSLIAYPNHLSF